MRTQSLALVSLIAAALLLAIPFSYAQAQTYPIRVNVASDGTQANASIEAVPVEISEDGRYVVFFSGVSNLVPNDTNSVFDAFLHDTLTGSTTRVSVASDGTEANGFSVFPSISADGRYVAFYSRATNFIPDDTNGGFDVFIHDMLTGSTTRVSVASDGTEGNAGSTDPSITADGRYVAFRSGASNLIPDDTNGTSDTFVHDMLTGSTTRISVASDGTQGDLESVSIPSISADGRYVAFQSRATNLVANDTNGGYDAFVHDTLTGSTTRVSVASDGTQGNESSGAPFISANGRYVAFNSGSSNLVPDDTNGFPDNFVHDILTGVTTRVSVASDGTQGNESSAQGATMSGDGRYVAFQSLATNVVPNDTNGGHDVFVRDMLTSVTTRISVDANGVEGNGISTDPAISADGRYIAFASRATNFVPNDTNGAKDIFLTQNPFEFPTNEAPVLNAIGNKSVDEGELLQFTVTATDPDDDALTFSAANLPVGATFATSTGVFSWTPDFDEEGNYDNVEFTVMDDGSPMELDVELITITVGNVNRAPVFTPVGPQEVLEEQPLTFTVSATDPDLDIVTLSASGTPSGATFSTSTGQFSWTPSLSQSGVYVVTFIATDDGSPTEASELQVVITVGDNPTPTEQAEDLVDDVVDADLPGNMENSYLANLNKVAIFIENGNVQAAINQLNAFINKVETDYAHNDITLAQRDQFVALAQALIDDLQ